jgi:hypothetical protein
MSRHLISCPHCGCIGATSADIEWFIDEPDYGEVETEYFDEDAYSEAPEATPTRQLHEPYKRVDEYVERIDDRSIRETHIAGTRTGGGLQVETVRNEPVVAPKPKRQTRTAMTQQLPTFNAVRPPRKTKSQLTDADAYRQGFESLGDDPSQDCYEGLSGKELHQEQLLQQAYESDVRNRGFQPESNFI